MPRNRPHPVRVAVLAVVALVAGCGDGDDPPPTARIDATVVKGPVVDGRLCAFPLAGNGAVALEPSECARLDAAGRATLAVPEAATVLLVASELRYRDEAAAGAIAALDGTLEAIVTAGGAGSATPAAVTALTHVAVASLRERATALSAPAYAEMLDRIAVALRLTTEQVRAVPAFDAATQPVDLAAATSAVFADLGRDLGTGVAAQMTRFAREFAKQDIDDALWQFNRQFGDAAAARIGTAPPGLGYRIYGWAGTTGPGAIVDGDRRCFARAQGIATNTLTLRLDAANWSLCIDRAPVGATCDAAFLRSLDYTNVDTNFGAANASAHAMFVGALNAFTGGMGAYRIEFANRCDAFPTLEATLYQGRLYRPGFLAPFE